MAADAEFREERVKGMLVVSPRSTLRVRGLVVDHLYTAPGFDALREDVRVRVLDAVVPRVQCSRCRGRWSS